MYRISLGERDFIGKARFCGFMVPNYFNSTLKNISDNNSCEKCFIQRVQKKIAYKNDCGHIQNCFINVAILNIEYYVVVNIMTEDWIYIILEFRRLNISI